MTAPARLSVAAYLEQRERWPQTGRHVLAHYDDETIVVYQAYNPAIAAWAVKHQRFGGPWSFERMSWIKPNFLWMMFRCGWATKRDQERVLAVHLERAGFDAVLGQAVHSSFVAERYADRATWQARGRRSDVRLQWDPDHGPRGGKLERRAIQLGLRRATLRAFAEDWCRGIEDITPFVHAQRTFVDSRQLDRLETPLERVYPVLDAEVAAHLGVAPGS